MVWALGVPAAWADDTVVLSRGDTAIFAFAAQPTEVETDQLPHRIQAQATGHDWIADKVATEEPELGFDIEFGAHLAFAEFATLLGDMGDAIEHKHRR